MRSDIWSVLEPVAVDPARKSWKDVLRNLVFHANLEGCAWPSVATIRAETGYKSAKAVIDALAGLCSLGLILPMEDDASRKSGRGCVRRWRLAADLSTRVDKLEKQADILERDTIKKGEVTSLSPKRVNLLPEKGEVTSKKGEVTSHRIYKEINKVSKLVSMTPKGEVTSRPVDNSSDEAPKAVQASLAEELLEPHRDKPRRVAPSAHKEASGVSRGPAPMDVAKIFPEIGSEQRQVDFLALCSELGWKPNDRKTVPNKAALEQARRAVVACAYREGLSTAEAKKFMRWNVGRKWSGIDRAGCVKDLAKLWLEKWQKEDYEAYCDERRRRCELARRREEQKLRVCAPSEGGESKNGLFRQQPSESESMTRISP